MISLDKIKPTNATAIVFSSISFFTVFLSFFLLSPTLFYSLELWELIGICIGIASPIVAWNNTMTATWESNKIDDRDERNLFGWVMGSIYSVILLNVPLLFCYYFSWSIKTMYSIVLAIEFSFSLYWFLTPLPKADTDDHPSQPVS